MSALPETVVQRIIQYAMPSPAMSWSTKRRFLPLRLVSRRVCMQVNETLFEHVIADIAQYTDFLGLLKLLENGFSKYVRSLELRDVGRHIVLEMDQIRLGTTYGPARHLPDLEHEMSALIRTLMRAVAPIVEVIILNTSQFEEHHGVPPPIMPNLQCVQFSGEAALTHNHHFNKAPALDSVQVDLDWTRPYARPRAPTESMDDYANERQELASSIYRRWMYPGHRILRVPQAHIFCRGYPHDFYLIVNLPLTCEYITFSLYNVPEDFGQSYEAAAYMKFLTSRRVVKTCIFARTKRDLDIIRPWGVDMIERIKDGGLDLDFHVTLSGQKCCAE